MSVGTMDKFDKKNTYAEEMARRRAAGIAESFNEDAIILEGPNEYIVIRGLVWPYRHDSNPSWRDGWPKWAKDDPDSKVLDIIKPSDTLQGKYKAATKLVDKMEATIKNVRYEQCFDLTEMFRDYGEVRQMIYLAQSAADHLSSVLMHLEWAVNDAIEDHKKNGKPERK